MIEKIKSSLITSIWLLFLVLYPISIAINDFNPERFKRFWESIIEYKYRILLVIFVHLILIIIEKSPFKKTKFLKLFLLRRKPIITIIIFIYPLLPDFQQRFWVISEGNITNFYAIFLPIFIMFTITSLMDTWDPIFLKEMKDTLNVNWETDYKTDLLIKTTSISTICSAYFLLFFILTWRISYLKKVISSYENTFMTYPWIIFVFFLGISWFLFTIIDHKKEKNNPSTKRKKINNKIPLKTDSK